MGLLCTAGTVSAEETAEIPNLHDRPIIEREGKRLLWAGEDDAGDAEWFDMTDSLIDPRLRERRVTRETQVLGVEIDGIARAYPVEVMSMHEVVNDEFGDRAYAVLW